MLRPRQDSNLRPTDWKDGCPKPAKTGHSALRTRLWGSIADRVRMTLPGTLLCQLHPGSSPSTEGWRCRRPVHRLRRSFLARQEITWRGAHGRGLVARWRSRAFPVQPLGLCAIHSPNIRQIMTEESPLPRMSPDQKRTVSCHSISLMATGSATCCICSSGRLASRTARSAILLVLRMHCSSAAGPSSR